MVFPISIIVPYANTEEPLEVCLNSIKHVFLEKEIIVIDMTPSKLSFRLKVKNSIQVITAPLLSASRARNLGAQHATTPYLFFLDSDCTLDTFQTSLSHLHSKISQNPDLIILQRSEIGRKIEPAPPIKYNFSLHCIEWNCIWRREHFLNLGGFDERFGPGSPTMAQTGEAFSLCFKHFAIKNTHTIYLPDIKVHHPSLDNSHKSPQRQFQYAYGSHYAAFEPFLCSPSRLAAFWFLRTLAGFGKDIRQAPLSFRARALALYDVVFGHQPRAKS